VKLVLENGALPDSSDVTGQTPLSRAIERGHVAVVQLLLAKDVKMDYRYNIRCCRWDGFFEEKLRTPLSRAAEKGHERVVKLLLENGALPDLSDVAGQTPLSRAIERGNVAVVQLLLAKEVKMDYRFNIKFQIKNTFEFLRTPLSRAAELGGERVVKLLLENGACPDFEDEPGKTPLSRAASAGQAGVVELLSLYCTSQAPFEIG